MLLTLYDNLKMSILQIVGAYLFERSSQFWEAALARLQTAGQLAANGENLFDQLRMSYDGLDPEEREMFVDIACIYDGRAVDEAKAIWVGCVPAHHYR